MGDKLLICPKCEKTDYVKDGFDRYNEQYYKCKSCNKKFSGINTSKTNNPYRLKGYTYPLPIILYSMRLYVCFNMNSLEIAKTLKDKLEIHRDFKIQKSNRLELRPTAQNIKRWYKKLVLTNKLRLFESDDEAELFFFIPKIYMIKKLVFDKRISIYCLFNKDYKITTRNIIDICRANKKESAKEYFEDMIKYNLTKTPEEKIDIKMSNVPRDRFILKRTEYNIEMIRKLRDQNNRNGWGTGLLEFKAGRFISESPYRNEDGSLK